LGGVFGKVERVKKNITEAEKITINHLLTNYMHPQLKESFKNIGEFEFKTFGIETDPQYARVTLPQDMVAQLTFQVKVGNEYTTFLIVLPYLSIEKYISKFKTDNVLRNRQLETSEEQIGFLNKNILQVKEDFIVNIGKTTISLKDIMLLGIGDVLVLDDISKGASAELKGKKKFLGKIGMKEKKFSFKITGML
jgi:flagellar motor switch protein FliM